MGQFKKYVFRVKKTFNFDIKELDWELFMTDYFWGTKKFLMKEDPSKAKRNLKKLHK
jgi:hypothetical protein